MWGERKRFFHAAAGEKANGQGNTRWGFYEMQIFIAPGVVTTFVVSGAGHSLISVEHVIRICL